MKSGGTDGLHQIIPSPLEGRDLEGPWFDGVCKATKWREGNFLVHSKKETGMSLRGVMQFHPSRVTFAEKHGYLRRSQKAEDCGGGRGFPVELSEDVFHEVGKVLQLDFFRDKTN